MTRSIQARIDHYGPFHVDTSGVKGYEGWAATFERWAERFAREVAPRFSSAFSTV